MEGNFEESSINVQFGSHFDGAEATNFKVTLIASESEVKKHVEAMKQASNDEIDGNNSVVIIIPCALQNQAELATILEQVIQEILGCGCLPITKEAVSIKSVKRNDKLYLNLKPAGEYQERASELKEMAEGFGFQQIASSQINTISVNASCKKTFGEIADDLKNGQSFFSSILSQSNLKINLSLDKQFPEKLKSSVSVLDPEIGSSPPILFLSYFSRFNLELKFNSTNELPELFKKLLLNPKKLRTMSPEDKKLKNIPPHLEKLLNILEDKIEIHFSVAECLLFNLEFSGPQFCSFLKDFGGSLKALFHL